MATIHSEWINNNPIVDDNLSVGKVSTKKLINVWVSSAPLDKRVDNTWKTTPNEFKHYLHTFATVCWSIRPVPRVGVQISLHQQKQLLAKKFTTNLKCASKIDEFHALLVSICVCQAEHGQLNLDTQSDHQSLKLWLCATENNDSYPGAPIDDWISTPQASSSAVCSRHWFSSHTILQFCYSFFSHLWLCVSCVYHVCFVQLLSIAHTNPFFCEKQSCLVSQRYPGHLGYL